MRAILFIYLMILPYCIFCQALFQFIEKGKIGFIDSVGKVIIKPIFRSAGKFSEGLAPARINGTYGYIDQTGAFVITPQFDYATEFSEGYAIAINENIPFYIDRNGKIPFVNSFTGITPFKNGRATVHTQSKKTGVIDKTGKLVIDTIFNHISIFHDGLAVVEGVGHNPNPAENEPEVYNIGVIDTNGNFVVPYGKYKEINSFYNNYAKVEIAAAPNDQEGETARDGFIDKTGNLVFSIDNKNHTYIWEERLNDGMAIIQLYKYWIPEEEGVLSTSEKMYEGYINKNGKIIVNDTLYVDAHEFSCGRAFVQDFNSKYHLLNTDGKVITSQVFDEVLGKGFENGLAFVKMKEKDTWTIIDTNVNIVTKTIFNYIEDVNVVENTIFFYELDNSDQNEYGRLYGIANFKGEVLLKPCLYAFDSQGFQNGLLQGVIQNKLAYVNHEGKVIWQESEASTSVEDYNIDFMNRGYFYAYSLPKEKEAYNGWGRSRNYSKKVTKQNQFPSKQLTIMVNTAESQIYNNQWNGYTLQVANLSGKTITFEAQDSRLNIKLQAKNKKGEWQDIEYLPNSWCGNSYHKLALQSGSYWEFVIPKYSGDFKTVLRAELQYLKSKKNKEPLIVYSNEFEASINPGQFWRKPDYHPGGIMDPYNE